MRAREAPIDWISIPIPPPTPWILQLHGPRPAMADFFASDPRRWCQGRTTGSRGWNDLKIGGFTFDCADLWGAAGWCYPGERRFIIVAGRMKQAVDAVAKMVDARRRGRVTEWNDWEGRRWEEVVELCRRLQI